MPQTAWSCASAYAADWEGGTVRSKCCARGAAQKRSSRPGTLQVRQLRQLHQQALLLFQALPRARVNVLRGADGRAEGNKPTLGQRLVAMPRLRAELRNARRSGAPGTIVDARFA